MAAVADHGTGKYADTTGPSLAVADARSDVENGEKQREQLQFGDQSSRLPTAKIITVSTANSTA
jgi:hypothetical protein